MNKGLVALLALSMTGCPKKTEAPSNEPVTIKAVDVRFEGDGGQRTMSLTLEIVVNVEMPHVAPELDVIATCDGKTDKADAFFMELSNAKPADQKRDEVKLFRVDQLPGVPASCELSLQLSEMATAPAFYCFRENEAKPGRCGEKS